MVHGREEDDGDDLWSGTSDEGEVQEDDAALTGVAVGLFKALTADLRFESMVSHTDLQDLAVPIREFLSGFFDGSVWPAMHVKHATQGLPLEQFFQLVLEVVKRESVPLGEDILVHAFQVIARRHMTDPRVKAFRYYVESKAIVHGLSDSSGKGTDFDLRKAGKGGSGKAENSTGELLGEEDSVEDVSGAVEGEDEEEEDLEEEETDGQSSCSRTRMAITSLEETLDLEAIQIEAIENTWRRFLLGQESRQSAGEAIVTAFKESMPSIAGWFKTPNSILGPRFVAFLERLIEHLADDARMKALVEELGFGHLHLDINLEFVIGFRDSMCDLLSLELSENFTTEAAEAWKLFLQYVGSGLIFVKSTYADRITIILESWAQVSPGGHSDSKEDSHGDLSANSPKPGGEGEAGAGTMVNSPANNHKHPTQQQQQQKAPSTFNEMFRFNAAVMGYSSRRWMVEVLRGFNSIVKNVANSHRLQEECDCLSLRIARITKKTHVKLGEFKSVMLASLRSLLPKEWSTRHETAWTWLWSNVERLLAQTMGKPRQWEAELAKALNLLSEEVKFELRKDVYAIFFVNAPAGQDHFKQSNTFLHFIAETVVEITVDIFKEPLGKVDYLSALGLRHVGYGVPTELFGPFVSACIEAVSKFVSSQTALEAFKWSLSLISKILTRTIEEGSTAIMKAINLDSASEVKKAAACAPRGQRAPWMLIVQAGNQSISPLAWALSSGRIEAAGAMIEDLLTIRADRSRYYYGAQDLFQRHPDIVKLLCDEAPVLLPTLLGRLMWRSHITEGGLRRVHYFVKYLLISHDGEPADTFKWLAHLKDPVLACHPIVAMLTDMLWRKVVFIHFFLTKLFVLISLLVFATGQSVLPHVDVDQHEWKYEAIFGCRAFVYIFSMSHLMWTTVFRAVRFYRRGDVIRLGRIKLPSFVQEWQEDAKVCLCLLLLLMLTCEPIFHCWSDSAANNRLFRTSCEAAEVVRVPYLTFVSFATALYFLLTLDLCILSNKVAAYVLVVKHVLSEFAVFLLGVFVLGVAFSCGMSCLKQDDVPEFMKIWTGVLELAREAQGFVHDERAEALFLRPFIAACVVFFLILSTVFLGNILIAQLTCSYQEILKDMVGFARLVRMRIIMEILPKVRQSTWHAFVDRLALDRPLEFATGDVGLVGGVEVFEPANVHPSTVNSIHRHAGSTDPSEPWPASKEELGSSARLQRMNKLEKLLQKVLQRLVKTGRIDKRALQTSQSIASTLSLDKSKGTSGGTYVSE